MNEAKQRGAFEERKAQAIVRNKIILDSVPKMSKSVKLYILKHGVQRFATKAVASGLMPKVLPIPPDGAITENTDDV